MSYIFAWECKKSGALAVLKGAPLSVLIAYTLYADTHGNTWAGSNSAKTRALNIATGLSHPAIAGNDGARTFLERHGAIKAVPKETIDVLYADTPPGKKPPVNAEVYHITCVIHRCKDEECVCKLSLHTENGESVLIFLTSKELGHEVDTIPNTLQDKPISKRRRKRTPPGKKPPVNAEVEVGITAKHIAIQTVREVTRLYPAREWFQKIADAIGESPEALEKWRAVIVDWVGLGFKPTNIKGMLEAYAKGGIEPRQPSGQAKRPLASNPADNPNYYEEAAARENEEYIPKGQRQPATASPALRTFASGKTAPEVWAIALDDLQYQLSPDVYHRLKMCQFVEYAEGEIVVRVETPGFKDVLEKRLAGKVETALDQAAGEAVPVRYIVAG